MRSLPCRISPLAAAPKHLRSPLICPVPAAEPKIRLVYIISRKRKERINKKEGRKKWSAGPLALEVVINPEKRRFVGTGYFAFRAAVLHPLLAFYFPFGQKEVKLVPSFPSRRMNQ